MMTLELRNESELNVLISALSMYNEGINSLTPQEVEVLKSHDIDYTGIQTTTNRLLFEANCKKMEIRQFAK